MYSEVVLTCLPRRVGDGIEHRFKGVDVAVNGLTEHFMRELADLLLPADACRVWGKERGEQPVRAFTIHPYPLRFFHQRGTIVHVLFPPKSRQPDVYA